MRLLLILALCLMALPAQAFQKPQGVPSVVVPDYDVTIAIWAAEPNHLNGYTYIAVYVQQSAIEWNTVNTDIGPGTAPVDSNQLLTNIAAAGGAKNWLISSGAIDRLNAVLLKAFPPIPGGPSPPPPPGSSPAVLINYSLGTDFNIRTENGVTALVPK